VEAPLSVLEFSHLDELSGVVYDKKQQGLYMIEDATSILSFYDFKSQKIVSETSIVPGGLDYEDVALDELGTVYVLVSNGDVLVKEQQSTEWKHLQLKKAHFLEEELDFESLVYDQSRHSLLLFCKINEGVTELHVYRFDLISGKISLDFDISLSEIRSVLQEPALSEFNPSAAAFGPDGRLYVIATSGQLLVVLDKARKVQSGSLFSFMFSFVFFEFIYLFFQVAYLPRDPYVQPEGLTFVNEVYFFVFLTFLCVLTPHAAGDADCFGGTRQRGGARKRPNHCGEEIIKTFN
jgi:hypothetical protein